MYWTDYKAKLKENLDKGEIEQDHYDTLLVEIDIIESI